jgi:sulfur-oxidizing protein SoxX
VNSSIPVPLAGELGNPMRGKAVAVNSSQGNCIICHYIPINEVPPGAFGDLGPSLAGIAGRLSEAELRLRIVDSKAIHSDTIMPAYHRVTGLRQVHPTYRDKPILSAREVEDLVAFLVTLREPAK